MAETDQPLVSIVTPCLDPGNRLHRCLESVARQTYPGVEHIVVDGGSRDGTVDVLRRTPGVRWVSEADAGQAQAINKGFSMASGHLLTWLNADDALLPRAAELAVRAVREESVEWIYGNVEIRWPGRRRIRKPPPRLGPAAFRARNPVPQPGTFFTAGAFHRVGGLDESFHLAADFDLWLRFQQAGIRSAYVPQAVAAFEIHHRSKTGASEPAEFWEEMARALLKAGRHDDARIALDRAFWRRQYGAIEAALVGRRWTEARRLAAAARSRTDPPKDLRMRLFLLATAASPRASRGALALSGRPFLSGSGVPADGLE